MKKAKTAAKNLFRGSGSSRSSNSKAPTSVEETRHSITAPEPNVTCSAEAVQTVAESASNYDKAASQTGTDTVIKNNQHAQRIMAETAIPESQPSSLDPLSTLQKGKECLIIPTRIARSLTKLDAVMTEFRKNYELFAMKNSDFLLLNDEFNKAFQNAEAGDNIKRSAHIFGDGIRAVLQTMETKKNIGKSAWLTKLGSFLTKVYPVAMLSLNLAEAVAETTSFMPLKGAAGGLGIILQLIGNESRRGDEFLLYLQRIEFQAALLADNPKYDLNDTGSSRNLIQEKATSLMTAIIAFFNSALIYFANNFFCKIGNTLVDGPRKFEDGKTLLDTAIREYDQAVFHLAARAVTDLKYQHETGQKQKKDEELVRWLSGPFESPWLVEGQLSLFRRQRAEATLEWARDMPEFQTWRLSVPDKNRFLWIRGTLGVGKSIMAAYFIDLLKCHYPNAIVGYFFCRSNQPGLTTARDIIRTLAYQFTENDEAARSDLDVLKRKGFGISENQEVDFLLEKLLMDPLRGTRKEIYIILDGVDEADMTTSNKFDRSGTPEMHVLLRSLTKLPSVRLLFISRATANICNIVPNTTVKTIGKNENAQDIKKYVQDCIANSNQLRTLFKNESKDPVKYFEEKANGIFLWVVLVIQQLKKAKTQSYFRKYLEGFSAASGSMETLYGSILSNIDMEYQKWVKEIIRWIVVAQRRLSVEDLTSLVEFSVNDKFADFEEFLKVDCGSILQLIPEINDPDGPYGVQLIHETFQSFVLKAEICPVTFLVIEEETHRYVALKCLQRLSSTDSPDTISNYWTEYWVSHLSKATSRSQSKILLVNLHRFFTSEGVKTWIKRIDPSRRGLIGLQVRSEEEALRKIRDWLCKCQLQDDEELFLDNGEEDKSREMVEEAVNWRRTILSDNGALGVLIGKAAARIWLYEALDQPQPLITCFRLALKYFWKRTSKTENNRDELNQLADTEFKAISVWAQTQEGHEVVVKQNIALAFLIIYRWDDCIRCFVANRTDNNAKFMEVLATAYMAKRDFDKAIDILKTAVATHPTDIRLLCYLSNACLGKGDYDSAIKTLAMTVENDRDLNYAHSRLQEACDEVGNYDTMIETFNRATSKRPSSGIFWYYLGKAYVAKGDTNGFLETFKTAIEKYPKERAVLMYTHSLPKLDSDKLSQINDIIMDKHPDAFVGLVLLRVASGDFDGALSILETAMDQTSGEEYLQWGSALGWVCRMKGEHDDAIKIVETALKDRQTNNELHYFLGYAYMVKQDYKRAIKALESASKEDDSNYRHIGIAITLFEACKLNQEYDAAIKVATSFVNKKNDFEASIWWSRLLEVYYEKGDYDAAIALFESVISSSDSFDVPDWSPLLEAYVAKSGYKLAIKRIETAINESQIFLSPSLVHGLLNTYKANGDCDGAIAWFYTLIDSRPTDGWAWNALADAYVADRQYDKAIDLYRIAIKQISIDYSFYLRLGDVYLTMSDDKNALDAYMQAINMAPTPVFKWGFIDMKSKCVRYFIPEIPIDGNLRRSFLWHALGEIYNRMGDYNAATKVYKSAAAHYKKAIEGLYNNSLRLMYSEVFEYNGSFDVFKRRNLPMSVLWSVLGEVHRASGKLADALTAFRKALNWKPDNSWLQGIIHEMATETLSDRLEDEATGKEQASKVEEAKR